MTKTDFDAKLSGLNRKITQNKSLLVENELNTLKNKIPDVSSLKKQIITLKLVKLILRYQTLMVKLMKYDRYCKSDCFIISGKYAI